MIELVMEFRQKSLKLIVVLHFFLYICQSAKINSPRVLLPWFDNLHINFTFEIIEGGCYSWSLSRDDIIDLEPLYEDTWGHCSNSARVSVSKLCVPPGSVIILAEEVNTGEILRGDVDIDKISFLKVTSTTWNLYLEEAPEAFEVVAYDDQENKFSTLEGVSFEWIIENTGNSVGDDPLVTLVNWRDTDYEAPHSVTELEAKGLRSNSVLLYGQGIGESTVTVCLGNICTDFKLNVIASVVLIPATARIALRDAIRYQVVKARAGKLTVQDVADTLYYISIPDINTALLEDTVSLVRGTKIGTTTVFLMSGSTEVATAALTVTEPHSIRVRIRPADLVIVGHEFTVHCTVLDAEGHVMMTGEDVLIRLTVEGDANVDLLKSTENGTVTESVALNAGKFKITARLHSIAGRILSSKVEGIVTALAVDPLEVVPHELYVAWTDAMQDIPLEHRGGGDQSVTWLESEKATPSSLSLTPTGLLSIRGAGEIGVRVQLTSYPHIQASGKVLVGPPELVQVSSSGHARVGRPHHLHLALTATHPATGELYNFHRCNCASFAVSLLEGPEAYNVTAATWVQPIDGACCVLEVTWITRGVSVVRVSRGRSGDTARVLVRAAPVLVWPHHVAALISASLPVLAEGEGLDPQSSDPRIVELTSREGPPPHRNPDVQLFTLRCLRKGDASLGLTSLSEGERESVELQTACVPHVSRIRLEPTASPGNCSGGTKVWLRPGQEMTIKVTLLDAIGRELLDERGPKVSWETEPKQNGIEFRASDRLFIETHPDYAPVPVPYKYYQIAVAGEEAMGWSGALKASISDARASIQTRVVAPLVCDPLKVDLAWEGETLSNIANVMGGSGRYAVEAPKGVVASVEDGVLSAIVPGPGMYELVVYDLCVHGERQIIEVNIEEVVAVEVSTSRAVCVDACVPITAYVRGTSHRYLSTSRATEWRVTGPLVIRDGTLCGLKEGSGRIRASLGGVWSADVEVLVFPPLSIIPEKVRLPPGAVMQLRHDGGPPPHLATLNYRAIAGVNYAEVSPTGSVHGLSKGKARVRLVATDITNMEMAVAESEVEVIPISNLRVRAATQTLLVGSPSPVWVEAEGLSSMALAGLVPPPKLTWTLRDPTAARLYTTHADDLLERSVAEGLSVRVVPLKPGVITLDVRVRNMGQISETRSWDSTIEILGILDIRASVEGLPADLSLGNRLALAVGAVVRLNSSPRSNWIAHEDGAFILNPNGEIKALKPGYGIVIAQNKDERNNVYREAAIHVEVSVPHYCTAQPSALSEELALRVVMRNTVGRELLAPHANASADVATLVPRPHPRRSSNSGFGTELLIMGLEPPGGFYRFGGSIGALTLTDEVWVTGSDTQTDKALATAGWAVCLEGVGWRSPPGVTVYPGSGVSLAVLTRNAAAKHVLKLDRPATTYTIHQIPVNKMEFLPGDWPFTMVPLTIEAGSLNSGPLLCTEDQKYALEGVQVEMPFSCRTKAPHTAHPVFDIVNGQIGCSITPASTITEPSEVELCAEWTSRTCTKLLLLPPIQISHTKVSLLNPPTTFTIESHPHTLKLVQMATSPGLKLETTLKNRQMNVVVKSDSSTCGIGWVTVSSKFTGQDMKVDVEKDCDIACGTLLGAIFSLLKPYLPTLVSIGAIAAGYFYVQYRLQQKSKLKLPKEPPQSVFPPSDASPPLGRSRTWSRSPYASSGPVGPIYGDTSILPDNSFSPTSRTNSRFL